MARPLSFTKGKKLVAIKRSEPFTAEELTARTKHFVCYYKAKKLSDCFAMVYYRDMRGDWRCQQNHRGFLCDLTPPFAAILNGLNNSIARQKDSTNGVWIFCEYQ